MPDTSLPTVMIYRDHLLPASETFVFSQAKSLKSHKALYGGSRIVKNAISLPAERTVVVNRGGAAGFLREGMFKILGYAPSFIRRIAVFRPRLIHAHFGPDATLALPVAHALNIPLIVTFHGYDTAIDAANATHSWQRRYLKRLPQLKQNASRFLAVSQYVARRLAALGFDEDRTTTHYVGVDTDWFTRDPSIASEKIVLFVGRLVEVKGCADLIQAMAIVQSKHPDVRLVVIGDGPLKSSLELAASRLPGKSSFLGTLPNYDVRSWMNRAAVFCVPSVTTSTGAAESFGLVFAEAQAMEVPVVSTRSGGIDEAVQHDTTGFLVRERDAESLAHFIDTLLSNAELRMRMGRAGRDRVCQLFNLAAQTSRLEQIYASSLAPSRSALGAGH